MDTIAAIATPIGISAIGIIKLSGPSSLKIVEKIYRKKGQKKSSLQNAVTHTLQYGFIIDPRTKKYIDEVLVSIMKTPNSYTREDVVEINCHGGKFCLYKILELVLQSGARLAEPGEFTKRSFLNGRIDLTQAESIIDLIQAKTEKAHSLIINSLRGNTFQSLQTLCQKVKEWEAQIEAELNFEKDITIRYSVDKLLQSIDQWIKITRNYLQDYTISKLFINGIKVVITGKRNVGKSSIMNRLVKKNRSIVTNIPGTTTDSIQDKLTINNIDIDIIDTAGICKTKNIIEQEGIKKSFYHIKQANILMMVLDGSQTIDEKDEDIFHFIHKQEKKYIVVLNKTDLGISLNEEGLKKFIPKETPILYVSSLANKGISAITQTIETLCLPDHDISGKGEVTLRQKILLQKMLKTFNFLKDLVINNQGEELYMEEFKHLNKLLAELQGKSISNDQLNRIFSKFCIGK